MSRCQKHPRYSGKRKPQSECPHCWEIWLWAQTPEDIGRQLTAEAELDRLKQQNAFYRKEGKRLQKERASALNLVENMKEALSTVEPQGVWKPPDDWPDDQEEEEAIALVSDCQIGSKSLGEEIGLMAPRVYGPIGTYNFNVFRYRLRIWLRSLTKITNLVRGKIPVRKLNLWFLGDILENEWIWKGQGSYIETGLLQQFYAAMYEFAQAIAVLGTHFETIEVHAVAGNHGRGTRKPGESKTWVNWEWLWYRYLELICRDIPNVGFGLTRSWYDLPQVNGHTYLIMHGEDVRRYMRFPWYSVDRMEKNYSEMMEAVGQPFTYLCFGHHHVASSFQTSKGEWFCNGNWVGPTMFSLKVLYEMALAKQWLFFSHPKRGATSRWLIDLMIEDEELWREVKETEPDIHIPPTNQEITAAMEAARWIKV